ncbi:MAG: metalloregulator ArsR/SmtB family transcription factor [Planctomycetota bacterium]|nr:metalloregulator ArsR/SmtB family transcription factor [Planctomycetota bacterium]
MARTAFTEAATAFGLFSDPTRIGILTALKGGPKNVAAFCKILGLEQSALGHHLGLLRMGRLIIGTRKGRAIVYTTSLPEMRAVVSMMKKLMPKK